MTKLDSYVLITQNTIFNNLTCYTFTSVPLYKKVLHFKWDYYFITDMDHAHL